MLNSLVATGSTIVALTRSFHTASARDRVLTQRARYIIALSVGLGPFRLAPLPTGIPHPTGGGQMADRLQCSSPTGARRLSAPHRSPGRRLACFTTAASPSYPSRDVHAQ